MMESEKFCSQCGAAVKPESGETAQTGSTHVREKIRAGKFSAGWAITLALALVSGVLLGIGGTLYFTGNDYQCVRYLKLAERCYEAGEYEKALEYCTAVLNLDDSIAEVYRLSSDIYLAQDKCVEAVQMLMDGTAATEAEELAERERYVREHIVIAEVKKVSDDGIPFRWTKYEYDANGNQTEEVSYDADGSIHCRYEYNYDEKGNQIHKVVYNADGSVFGRYEYGYDEAGNKTRQVVYGLDGSAYLWYEWEYDEEGNQTREATYGPDGSVNRWREYEYDERGNETKKVGNTWDGSFYWYEYEYDERDNQIKMVNYDVDGSIHEWYEYEYDVRGNQTKKVRYHGDGSIYEWYEYEYDERGSRTKETSYNGDGSIRDGYEYEYEYDGRGSRKKEVCYTRYGSLSHWYEYEYDVLSGEIGCSVQAGLSSLEIPCTVSYRYHYTGD